MKLGLAAITSNWISGRTMSWGWSRSATARPRASGNRPYTGAISPLRRTAEETAPPARDSWEIFLRRSPGMVKFL